MRKFILHTADKTKSFDLNNAATFAAEPTGLGNAFSISYKESDKGKHLVNVKPEFEPIKLKIYFNADASSGYINYKSLLSFLAECGTSIFLFEYNDGVTDKYCDIVLKSMPKSEINEEGLFAEEFVFERQTYWYEQVAEYFALKSTEADATAFPLGFPFGFMGNVFQKQYKIKNKFFISAPIALKISGYIKNNIRLYIATLDGAVVAEVQLSRGNTNGTTIIIEPTTKKITVIDEAISQAATGLPIKQSNRFYICRRVSITSAQIWTTRIRAKSK